ncbi:unnamed protein product, partial [Closterium sp. NIES-53]
MPPSRAAPLTEPRRQLSRTALHFHTTSAATTATAVSTAMASPNVLTFDAEGRAVDFDVWVDDLQLFLQCDSRDGVSLYDHTSGVSTAPAATADSTVCSQWTTRDAVARLAVRSHLLPAKHAHFGQYKTARSLYDAVVARYSSPATAALKRLMLPYLFPDLAAFATIVIQGLVRGESDFGTDVLEDRQEDFECFAASVPHLVSMLIAREGHPDAPDIPTPCYYAEAIEGPYSSQWHASMDAKMASWKSTGTYVDEVPPPGANIVSGMWIFRRDYELHSLDLSTAFLQGSLHEEIWLRRPPGFTGSFPAGTRWSLKQPVYGLRQAPREWHDTLKTTLAALGFAPSTSDPSLFLHTDTTLPPFYVLVYVDDLVFATANTEALAHVKAQHTITLSQSHMVQQVLQRFGFTYSSPQSTPVPTGHSLSAPPSDESVEPSGSYPELVGCLMCLMTCTRPNLTYPLSLLAHYVAPGRHRKVHWDAAKWVLRYLCSTSGMGLVLGGRARVVLSGHADASWVDDSATQRS